MNEHVIDIIPTRHPNEHTEISVDADTVEEALTQALAVVRGRMRTVRYAGDYHGPSYGNPGYPSFEGFKSLGEAERRFYARQRTSGTWALDSTELTIRNGIITNVTPQQDLWPATSAEDELDLYHVLVTEDGKRVIASEPFMRLSVGPRGGIVRERY